MQIPTAFLQSYIPKPIRDIHKLKIQSYTETTQKTRIADKMDLNTEHQLSAIQVSVCQTSRVELFLGPFFLVL